MRVLPTCALVVAVAGSGLVALGSPANAADPGYTLSIVAGNGSTGPPTPGPATDSALYGAFGVATDAAGNYYIVDNGNSMIEKVDATTGILSIVAGTGTYGPPTPGPATSSNLAAPRGVAVDGAGNVYIADSNNLVVERVDATTGMLSIVAGTGTYGSPTPGPATSSNITSPTGVAVDSAGNVYIADSSNYVVEKVDATDGTLSIVAGTGTYGVPTPGPATSSALLFPYGVAVDAPGNIFIADSDRAVIEKVDTSGTLSIVAGTGNAGAPTPGPATQSDLNGNYAVAVDAIGNLYIADSGNNVIEKVDTSGTLSIVAGTGLPGSPTTGPATSSQLAVPLGVAADSSGHVFVALYSSRILKLTPVNRAPVAIPDSYTTDQDTALSVAAAGVLANDTDDDLDTLTAVEVTSPTHGTLSLEADGSFTYTPTSGYSGPDSFTYRTNDGLADSSPATVTLTVTPGGATPGTVTATAPSPTYPFGATVPATFTPTYAGYATGENPTTAPTCTSTATTGRTPGTYPVTCTGGVADSGTTSYTFAYDPGTLTIVKAGVTASTRVTTTLRQTRKHKFGFRFTTRATNAANGAGVQGSVVTIKVGRTRLCQATTNNQGVATCTNKTPITVIRSLRYTATRSDTARYNGGATTTTVYPY
jgi:VCBS repeat-containing protein